MPKRREKVEPVVIGFHRDALIITLILDWVWAFLEFGAGATIAGIAAIPLISFVMFCLGFMIVWTKQHSLGDNTFNALWKSTFLGVIAGFPTPIFYSFACFIFASINAALPKTKGVSVKFPSGEYANIGKFTNEYREAESLLKKVVEKAGGDTRKISNVNKCIDFLEKQNKVSKEMVKSLHEIRKIRNDYIHDGSSMTPNEEHFRLLRKCKEEIEMMYRDGGNP